MAKKMTLMVELLPRLMVVEACANLTVNRLDLFAFMQNFCLDSYHYCQQHQMLYLCQVILFLAYTVLVIVLITIANN